MDYKDYYATLGLDPGASADEVKKAYRKLARKYHPDVSKEAGAEARFKEVAEAYEVLKDPEKRAAYDALRQDLARRRAAGQGASPPPDWDAGFEFRGAAPGDGAWDDHSDFFHALFGAARRGRVRRASGAAKTTMLASRSSWKTSTAVRRAACRCGRRCWTVRAA